MTTNKSNNNYRKNTIIEDIKYIYNIMLELITIF